MTSVYKVYLNASLEGISFLFMRNQSQFNISVYRLHSDYAEKILESPFAKSSLNVYIYRHSVKLEQKQMFAIDACLACLLFLYISWEIVHL